MKNFVLETSESMPILKVAFFFLMLFIFSSFIDLRFAIFGKGLLSLSNFELCSYLSVLTLIASAYMHSFLDSHLLILSESIHRWLISYLIWGIIAAFIARGDVGKSMLIDLKLMLPGVIAYCSIILMMTSNNKAKLLIAVWTCAGLVNVLLALSQYFFGGPHPVKLAQIALEKLDIGGATTSILVTGFFSHPNSFSQIIIPYCVVFTSSWLLSDKLVSSKSLKLFFLGGLFGFVLILSSAKGAILWSFIAIIMSVMLSRWRKLRSTLFFIIFWLFCVVGINSVALLLVFNLLEYDALRTLFSRIQFIVASINIFIDHPMNAIFGGGMRFWPEYSAIWSDWDFFNAHNVYLNQMLLYGFIGLFLLVFFVIGHVRRGITCAISSVDPLISPLPYISAIFAMTGSYFFEPSFNDPIQKFQLLFLLATVFVLSKVNSADRATLFNISTANKYE